MLAAVRWALKRWAEPVAQPATSSAARGGGGDTFPAPTPPPSAQSALSGFDGMNPNGVWKLRVVDDFSPADGGSFAGGWSITIKARVQT